MAQRNKFVIQPFKHNQQMDEEYANRTWQTLHDAIKFARPLSSARAARRLPPTLAARAPQGDPPAERERPQLRGALPQRV